MKIIETSTPGTVMIDCLTCGTLFSVPDFRGEDEIAQVSRKFYESKRHCPACEARMEAERIKAEARRDLEEFRALLPLRVSDAGIPPAYITDRKTGSLLQQAPCPHMERFLNLHQADNILLGGETGTGKSTAACLIAVRMIAERKNVAYTTLRRLAAAWRAAKTGDQYATERMLRDLYAHDLLIIDEFAGKACITESTQEMLFALLESVNNGTCRSRLWLIGNFYQGSIADIFGEDGPARRRLQENFVCAVASWKDVRTVNLWDGRSA